jgi:hypothetical protein
LPTSPPKTRLPQTGQELRSASPPFAAFEVNFRVEPLKRIARFAKPMYGTKPDPQAFWQSAQKHSPV